MRNDLILSGWSVECRGGAREDDFLESVFFTGCGRMGVRGYLPCLRGEKPVHTGLYIAGIFGEIKPGITDFVNLPTPFCEDYRIDGTAAEASVDSRVLDMRRSLLRFDYTLTAAGKRASVRYLRFFPRDNPGICLQRTVVHAESAMELTVDSGMMLSCCNCPIPDDQTKENSETVRLALPRTVTAEPHGFCCALDIKGTGLTVEERCLFSLPSADTVQSSSHVLSRFVFSLAAGESVTLDKLCYVTTSRDADKNIQPPGEGWSFDALLARHEAAWDRAWEGSDFTLSEDGELQCALRYSIYQLMCSCSRGDPTVSIGARGITHGRYKGCYFWDTDFFMLPFYIAADPAAARNLCEYRVRALPAAKAHSAKMNTRGARYPWMAALDGSEQCETWDIGCSELHVTADVVYALDSYCRLCHDRDFYLSRAAAVYVETARFWESRCTLRPDGTADLLFCKGPDEYCGVTNNNLFTVAMVQNNLTLARQAAEDLKALRPEIYSSLSLTEEESEGWLRLRDGLKWPRDPVTGHLTTDDSFHLLEPVDIRTLKEDDRASYHAVCFDRLQRYKAVKQADVLLLMTRLPELFTREEKLTAWQDFEPICLHDSTLSFASHALFALENGLRSEGMAYLRKALLLDLRDIMGNTGKEGLHLACMGEAWQAASVMQGRMPASASR